MRQRRHLTSLAAVSVMMLATAGCGQGASSTSIGESYDLGERRVTERGGGDNTRLRVGSKDFSEQEILGQITLQALAAAGAEVEDHTALGDTEAVRNALVSAEIDMYWEYTGTGSLIHLAQDRPPSDPTALYDQLAEIDLERNGIEWLAPSPANNTYAVAVRAEVSEKGSDGYDEALAAVTDLSALGRLVEESPEKATVCIGAEFNERADGLPGLEERYGFDLPAANVFVLPDSTVYRAVDAGQKCNFGSVFETSGYLPELDLALLGDDQDYFAAYNPALTMRAETLELYPDLAPLFEDIALRLDTETLRRLDAEVLIEQRPADDVARDWLEDEGLV